MKRIYKIGMLLAALVALVGLGARASAHGGKDFFKNRIVKHVDEALDAARATPEQRTAIAAARDHVFDAFADGHQNRAGELEEALGLFQSDHLDAGAVAAHRARREAEVKKVGDAIVQALYDAHDALSAPQRRAVVDWVRAQAGAQAGGHGNFREKLMQHMVDSRLEAALDEIKATPAQRASVVAAKDHVLSAFKESRPEPRADLDKALALFAADRIDAAQLEALRAEHQARFRKLADTVVQAISDVHATLSTAQRKALVDWVRAHHAAHGHG